ncbi:hypothetical protein T01_9024 [Trichinella spiralis]|uniref:Uncharacterized protein n=1 Tax=Trichinella spiralis TaxID=6334 RepID=A0A0V0YXA6_TRISP|nr:hypothetical protein T01_9024 [Trichinella spiralis]
MFIAFFETLTLYQVFFESNGFNKDICKYFSWFSSITFSVGEWTNDRFKILYDANMSLIPQYRCLS